MRGVAAGKDAGAPRYRGYHDLSPMTSSRSLLVSLLCALSLPSFAATDTTPAANFTINGTPGFDDVTIGNGPGGTTTVSSPSFESVTFANKTNVLFDGLGGGDRVKFSNANPASGLVSLIVKNVTHIEQTAPVRYPLLGLDAAGEVELSLPTNDVDRLEITAGHQITFADADDLGIGGVSTALAGMRTPDGLVYVTTVTGDITLSDTDAAEVISGGEVTLKAGRDLTIDVDRYAIASLGDASIFAGRDVVLGKNGYANDVRAGGNAGLGAGRTLRIAGLTTVLGSVTDLDITALDLGAGDSVEQRDSAMFIAAGINAQVVLVTSVLSLTGNMPGLQSPAGFMYLYVTEGVVIGKDSGISAPAGRVKFVTQGVRLGTIADLSGPPVKLSDEELDRITAREIVISNEHGSLDVTAPITIDKKLTLEMAEALTSSASGRLEAPELSVSALVGDPIHWTITSDFVQWDHGVPILYSGVTTLSVLGGGNRDTFEVTPSTSTEIFVYGYGPNPPATPGDTLTFDLDGVADPVLHAALHSNGSGYQGTLTSSNRRSVQFFDIESFEGAPVNPPRRKTRVIRH